MATYVMSDVHGQKEKFDNMLKKIKFNPTDTLYILGDLIDRGPNSIELLKRVKDSSNITLLRGNHEQMMLESISLKEQHETDTDNEELLKEALLTYQDWLINGGEKTLKDFRDQPENIQQQLIKYISGLPDYIKLTINDKQYILIHAGIYIPNKSDLTALLEANIRSQLHLYVREDFWNKDNTKLIKEICPDKVFIVGHTSTRYIPSINKTITKSNLKRCNDNRIYKEKYKIGVDCGAHLKGGQLACLRLDDMKEYYI